MDKLSDMGIQVFRTDEQGTIIAVSDGNSIEWNQNPVMITHREMNPIPVHSPLPFMMIPEVLPTDPSTHPITIPKASAQAEAENVGDMVWISATGSKYHRIPNCGNMNPNNATEMTRSQAEAAGYDACKKCY